MTFEKVLAAGLTSVALAGCGEGEKRGSEPLTVTGDSALQLYQRAYDMQTGPGPKAGALEGGSKVVAKCLAEAEDPVFSSVKVDGQQDGYSGVYSLDGSKDSTPTLVFNKTLKQLKEKLPNC